MRYLEAISYLFRGPRWAVNLLCGGLCMLIPVIGPIVFLGYVGDAIDVLRKNPRNDPPDFDFGRFVPYLERGIWPFLVHLIVSVATLPALAVAALPLLAIPIGRLDFPAALGPIALTAVLAVLVGAFAMLLAIGMGFRALMTRDLGRALSPDFARDFVGRVGWEAVGAMLVYAILSIPIAVVGYACCVVGVYPAAAALMMGQWHLTWQLYELYRRRGGPPIDGVSDAETGWE